MTDEAAHLRGIIAERDATIATLETYFTKDEVGALRKRVAELEAERDAQVRARQHAERGRDSLARFNMQLAAVADEAGRMMGFEAPPDLWLEAARTFVEGLLARVGKAEAERDAAIRGRDDALVLLVEDQELRADYGTRLAQMTAKYDAEHRRRCDLERRFDRRLTDDGPTKEARTFALAPPLLDENPREVIRRAAGIMGALILQVQALQAEVAMGPRPTVEVEP